MTNTISIINQFISNEYIEFAWLWAIFPPGELVAIVNVSASDVPIQWCANIKAFEYREMDSGGSVWSVTVTHTAFNGLRFGTAETSLTFPAFHGHISIHKLSVYPLRFFKEQLQLQQDSIRRGKTYEEFCLASSRSTKKPVGTAMFHDGPIWTAQEPGAENRRGCRIIDNPSSHVCLANLINMFSVILMAVYELGQRKSCGRF